ncbi:Uncharacterized protein HZ326_15641 [Fusarium oxysporum f. sp. albedinis]|jgi:hypothetical protein|nr:Uncharacterized protein HZ326_15641 [Fusarium oxysporum f. sp. albedinis]KAK2473026.1 hypothetical protein H9L39_15201 [Fusarium oxysporum f. sp. albedinis]
MAAQEIDVGMDQWRCAKGNTVLSTGGLLTCIRVAIVGEYPTGYDGYDRFLVHISESPPGKAAAADLYNAVVNAMNDHDFEITEATLVVPDPRSEDDEAVTGWVYETIDYFNQLADGEIEVEAHDTNEYWELGINSEKEIFYGAE